MAAKVAINTTKISRRMISSKRGFTLLEVLIVVSILGGLIAVGLPRLRTNRENIKSVTRKISVLSREVRTYCRLKSMTCRLVFDFGENKEETYWVEGAPGSVAIMAKEAREKLESLPKEEQPASPFQKLDRFGKKPFELPDKIFVGNIETPSNSEPVTKGPAYIYYSPEGLVEKAAIQITNKSSTTWTVIINPLTGQGDVVEKAMSLKDLRID